MTATLSLNTRLAQELKLTHLIAAVEGDDLAMPVWADWLEENGSDRASGEVRKDLAHWGKDAEHRNIHGETSLEWFLRYRLAQLAEKLVRDCTAFPCFAYRGNYRPDGGMMRHDGSMEAAMKEGGYVPTLRRSKPKHVRLGRIIEALDFRVFWIS